MGGHGGLNILPQKKWNVYNYDNRAIVEKDKETAAREKKNKFEKRRQDELQGKIDVLKDQNQEKNEPENEKHHSLISKEL